MMKNETKNRLKERDSSMELLRIIVMIMIVLHHFAIHGGFQWESSTISLNRFWYNFILIGGKIGVDVFVFISGYFLINNTSEFINFEKIIKFLGQVIFYSIVIYCVFVTTGITSFGYKSLIKTIFPITYSKWWFASTYIVLYLLHPFLNILLHSMEKSIYQKYLGVLVICWSVIPTFTTSSYTSNPLLWFVTLYSISGYIRLYGLNCKLTIKHYGVVLLVSFLLTYSSSVVFTVLGRKWEIFSRHATYFYGYDKITILIISLCLFMIFVELSINYHKLINLVASATFGVYLIHENPQIRLFLWLKIFKNYRYQDSIYLIPYSIIVVSIVYIICTLIDLFRQFCVEKLFMKIVNLFLEKIVTRLNRVFSGIKHAILG